MINNDKEVFKITKVYDNGHIVSRDSMLPISINLIEAWTPESKEWCLFYNTESKSMRLSQFEKIAHGAGVEGLYKDRQGNYFKFCEPFIGELPASVKEWTR